MRYWTEADDALLTVLWAEGLACAEIGRRMNATKNAVVGRAHRLRLPTRGSPIGLRREDRAPGCVAMPGVQCYTGDMPSLPPLKSAKGVVMTTTPPAPVQRRERCAWLSGDRPYLQCDAPSVFSRPYCAEHVAICYVRVRDRREDATP